jgi:hypothetical protein
MPDQIDQDDGIELLVSTCNHMRDMSEKILQLSQGMMALVGTLEEMVPGFEAAYKRNLLHAEISLENQGIAVPVHVFDRIVAKLRRTGP